MKKFYSTLALAAAVCLSASAQERMQVERLETVADIQAAMSAAPQRTAKKAAPQKAIATTIDELCGLYSNTYYSNEQSGWEETNGNVVVIPGTESNTVQLVGLCKVGQLSPTDRNSAPAVEGKVNFRAAQIEFPAKQSIGYFFFGEEDGYQEVVMTHKVPGGDGKLVESNDPIYFDFYEDGTIESSTTDYYVAMLPNYLTGTYSMIGGSILACMMQPQTLDMTGWTSAGTCQYLDEGFVLALWGWTNGTPTVECEVYTNPEVPNVFRLYNPYGTLNELFGEDGYKLNDANIPGVIDLDVTDPNCVLVPDQFNGEVMADEGAFSSSNTEWSAVDGGATTAEVIASIGADKVSSYNAESGIVFIQNCQVSFGSYKNKKLTDIYTWNDPANTPPCTFTVQLPDMSGIDNIVATETAAPVEYYNLQGIRVNNPEHGVYIRVQGKNVTKVIR